MQRAYNYWNKSKNSATFNWAKVSKVSIFSDKPCI